MKIGQKVYIPLLKEVGTIEEIKGKRISKVKIKDKIIDVFDFVVENYGIIQKLIVLLSNILKFK
jgi:hypothetical protein